MFLAIEIRKKNRSWPFQKWLIFSIIPENGIEIFCKLKSLLRIEDFNQDNMIFEIPEVQLNLVST